MIPLPEHKGLAMSFILWSEATPMMAHFMFVSIKGDANLIRKIEDKGGRPRSPQSHSEEDAESEHPDNTLHTYLKTNSKKFQRVQRVTV